MTVTIRKYKQTRAQKCKKEKRNVVYIAVSLGRWTIVFAAKSKYFETKQGQKDSGSDTMLISATVRPLAEAPH